MIEEELEPCLLHMAVAKVLDKPAKADHKTITKMLRNGSTYAQISDTLNVSSEMIARAAKANGMIPDKARVKRLDDATRQKIMNEFKKFPIPTSKEIARKYGVAESTVRVYRGRAFGGDY